MEYTFSNKISALQPSAIREILKATADPAIIPLAAGNPAPDAFPVDEVRAITADILQKTPIDALQYGVSEGYQPLRDTVRDWLARREKIGTDGDDLLIVSGATQIMDLVTKVLCNEGDTVICEEPSFIGSTASAPTAASWPVCLWRQTVWTPPLWSGCCRRTRVPDLSTPFPISKTPPAPP